MALAEQPPRAELDDQASFAAGWAEPVAAQGQEETIAFREMALNDLLGISKTYPSPQAYLKHFLSKPGDQQKFTTWLRDVFPESEDTFYHHEVCLPGVSESELGSEVPICVHVSSLGFDKVLQGPDHDLLLLGSRHGHFSF